jgi:hypothetical protein
MRLVGETTGGRHFAERSAGVDQPPGALESQDAL